MTEQPDDLLRWLRETAELQSSRADLRALHQAADRICANEARIEALESRVGVLERAMAAATPNDADPGEFIGDIFFGDTSNSTRGTHRWNGATWEALPTDAEALTELLAKSRSRIAALESRERVLREVLGEMLELVREAKEFSGDWFACMVKARAALIGEQK